MASSSWKIDLIGQSPDARGLRVWGGIGLALLMLEFWVWRHPYKGLVGDAELYAFQAFARAHSNLTNDLYLKFGSQDGFSIFSGIYSKFATWLGLQHAALTLWIACSVGFFGAAWMLARELWDGSMATLCVLILVIAVGTYGAYGVFHYAEDMLTARSLAEALIVASLGCLVGGAKVPAFAVASIAMLVHPLMALPGLLLLISMSLPVRVALSGAVLGTGMVLGSAVAATVHPMPTTFLKVLDPEWLEVVRERSNFLFLQLWSGHDWAANARPFVALTLSASVLIDDERIQNLSTAAMLVGATGVSVAAVASTVGPVAILLQGQAWRWVWVTSFTSVLLLAPTVAQLWRERGYGPLIAALALGAWALRDDYAPACGILALGLWVLHKHSGRIPDRRSGQVGAVLACGAVVFLLIECWRSASIPGNPRSTLDILRGILQLQIVAFALVCLVWPFIRPNRCLSIWITAAALGAALCYVFPVDPLPSYARPSVAASSFADWRAAVPPTSNVYVMPSRNSAALAWFTLERPSYLSVNQSAGVVFSRETAMEVRRRSQVLLPVMDPDWRIKTSLDRGSPAHGEARESPRTRHLTKSTLILICRDPQMGFVVSKDEIDAEPLVHTSVDAWKNWRLYDCGPLRPLKPPVRVVPGYESHEHPAVSSGG